ncbi:MAG: CPBP family intramembrane metalloprotease, partial [Clostridia bacterium]|nr:CPBP family intramembrane metalloprotease [Clostridia bacterium]
CLLTEQVVGLLATLAAYGAIWAVNFFIVRGYFGSQFLHTNTEAVKYLCECVAYVVYMFIPFILITYVLRVSPARSVNARKIARPWLLLAAVPTVMSFYFAGNFFTDIIVELLRLIHLNPVPPSMLETPTTTSAYVIFCIKVCVFAPIIEEFIFRGLIMRSLLRFGSGFAIVMSSLLFAMLHGNLAQIPFAFIVGLSLGYFAYKLNSVWASVILHSFVNTTSTVIDFIQKSMGNTQAQIVSFALMGIFGLLFLLAAALLYRTGFFSHSHTPAAEKTPVSIKTRSFLLTPGFMVFLALTVALIVLTTSII